MTNIKPFLPIYAHHDDLLNSSCEQTFFPSLAGETRKQEGGLPTFVKTYSPTAIRTECTPFLPSTQKFNFFHGIRTLYIKCYGGLKAFFPQFYEFCPGSMCDLLTNGPLFLRFLQLERAIVHNFLVQ